MFYNTNVKKKSKCIIALHAFTEKEGIDLHKSKLKKWLEKKCDYDFKI